MTPSTHPKIYPLSAMQTEIWLAQQLNPESPMYNVGQFTEIPGIIDATLFEEALSQVLMEAECMRLQFIESENGIEQFVGPLNWTLPLIDVSADANPQEAAEAWMRHDYEQPIDLQYGLKFRYALLKVATNRYLWYQCTHHIIMDGFGFALVLQRAAQIYTALVKDTTAPKCTMKPLSSLLQSSIDYRNSTQFTSDREYWLEHCKDWPDPVTLTGKKAVSVHLPLRQTIHYSSQSVSSLSSDPRRFTYAVIAVIATYLHRWTGIEEVTLGFAVKARFGEDRHIPGPTSNVLPIRITVQPSMSLSSLIEQVAQEVQNGLRHQRYRSEELRRSPQLGRSRHLYGPTINFMPFDRNVSFGPYLSTVHNLLTGPTDDLAINIYVGFSDGPLRIDFAANPTLYTAEELVSHQRRIVALLDTLATNPSQSVTAVKISNTEESHRLLVDLNDTTMPYPEHQCIHQLFEGQALRDPTATALVYEDQALSYGELNERANRLAHRLIELGVQPDERVAICVERSPAMVVGQLAIMKAGGAYVPLDPAYPLERLVHILTDAAPSILLADVAGRTALGESALASVTVLDPNAWHGSCTNNPYIPGLTSRHLVYVIYTSGSTGAPKGVMVEHRNLSNLCTWYNSSFSIRPGTICTSTSGVAFDATACEVWPAMICGATLAIPGHSISQDVSTLLKWWSRQNLEAAILVTPLAVLALEEGLVPSSLRYLMTGGDRFPSSLKSLPPGLAIVNNYGPTETTILATSGQLRIDDSQLHIGRPIANTRIYLLDPYGHPVPLGAIGELYIGGAGVARGYLNRPELTVERFISDPFSTAEGARMYKTGDLGRYLPNGNLEFLGRNDCQVKIRGHRVELEEIEAHLVDHPHVREAVVLALGDGGNKRLIAYVIAVPDEHLVHTLRSHLTSKLPDYMLPAAFVRMDSWPLTQNGKFDRQALPPPGMEAFIHGVYEAPQGKTETMLAEIWKELLSLEHVSRHGNFFEMGGHSLLAVQMVERLRRQGLTVSIRVLFDTPTLCTLAQSLENFQEKIIPPNLISTNTTILTPDHLPLIKLNQFDIDCIVAQVPGGVSNIQDIYSLTPLQDGVLFHYMLSTVGDPHLEAVKMTFQNRHILDCYLDAAQCVVNRHDTLRTSFFWKNLSTPAQVVWRHAPISITEVTFNPNDGPIMKQLTDRFGPHQHQIDLNQAPLVQFIITQDQDNRWLGLCLVHHMIVDHSTLDLMQAEIHAFMEGRGDTLPPAQPFRNLVAQTYMNDDLGSHKQFFTDMLGDIEEPTLAFGLTDVHSDVRNETSFDCILPQELNDRLRAQSKRFNVSLACLCHLAWSRFLACVSGQQQVVFGTILLGRTQTGGRADQAFGLFINSLPLRVDLSSSSVQESIRQIHANLAELLPHEHAQLALAQRCSGVPAGVPLFNSQLNYRHTDLVSHKRNQICGIELSYLPERTTYPLAMDVDDFGTALGLTCQIVEPFDASRVCGYVKQTLQSIVEALEHTPQMPVCQLEVLPNDECELLLRSWNETAIPYPEHQCIHKLFEDQTLRDPTATALVYEDQALSYGELNERANRLAHQLIELGVQPDERVAICVERSPAMVVGQLAIMKAGGAYVPLDPAYPLERLVHILTDAAPSILLADVAGRAALGESALASVTVLDPNAWHGSCTNNPYIPDLTSRHLVYVIYTSDSTGAPKGVMVEHRNLSNLCTWYNSSFSIRPGTICTSTSGVAFDVTACEIWPAMICGATLAIPGHSVSQDVSTLLKWWNQQNLVAAILVTPLAVLALEEGLVPSSLRYLMTGGDRFPSSLKSLPPGLAIMNNYGSSETTILATSGQLRIDDSQLHIGRPIANTRIYLLDPYGHPVPLGAIGELYIGGAGVARGYLNRPELTSERFLPDPFGTTVGARMYRSGDMARYLPNGSLEFLGRNDSQVNIRGYRIELGEIETHLVRHPKVREAAVLAFDDESNKRLIAYVATEPDESLAHTLRSYLTSKIPEYMLPSAFVRIDALPLTPTRKLNRRALPPPEETAYIHHAYEAPQGKIETMLAEIWSELLGLECVSRHDNFFELGGHSLLAVRMISHIHTKLGIDVALKILFESPSIVSLASQIEKEHDIQNDSFDVLLPIQSKGNRPPLFCIHPAVGLSWSYFGLSKHLGPEQPIYGLQARGHNGEAPLAETIEDMASDYLDQIRSIQPKGPYNLLGWSFGGIVAHSIATLLQQQNEKVALLTIIDSALTYSHQSTQLDTNQLSTYIQLPHYRINDRPDSGDQLWKIVRSVVENNLKLAKKHSPMIYYGNVLFFRATVPEEEGQPLITPEMLKPYIIGVIDTRHVHCKHSDMDKPTPVADIGGTLAKKLEQESFPYLKSRY